MDLFRKKKVRKLLDELEDTNNMLIQERSKTKNLQESVNNLERISTQAFKISISFILSPIKLL